MHKPKVILKNLLIWTIVCTCMNLALFLYEKSVPHESTYLTDDEIDHPGRLLDMHDFEYIIPQPSCRLKSKAAARRTPKLVVLVHSAPFNLEKRQALRETWLHADPRVLSFFMLGGTHSKSLLKKIKNENDQYGDIIQGSFIDGYLNMTYKHAMVLKWFNTYCSNVDFLLKIDDDVFANIPAVLEHIEENKNGSHSIMGRYAHKLWILRTGKHALRFDQWKEKISPEYCHGAALIYSSQYVRDAYDRTLISHMLWLDDVYYTGLIRALLLAKIMPINDNFLWKGQWRNFFHNQSIVSSKPTFLFAGYECKPDMQHKFWEILKNYQL